MAFEDLFKTAAPSTPTGISTTEAGIPTAFRPQVEGLLGSATQQVFNVSPTGQITGARGYTPYSTDPQDYVAGFSPLQQQAFSGIAGLTLPGQFGTASDFISQAMQRALGTAYQPGTFANQYRAPSPYRFDEYEPEDVTAPRLSQYQMGPAERVSGATTTGATLGAAPLASAAQFNAPSAISYQPVAAQQVTAPSLRSLSMQAAAPVAAQQVGTPLMSAAQTAYRPDLRTFQMGPAERVGTTSFTAPRTAESFMSPYMQNVVNRQQQAAQREADIQRQALGAQFAQAGAFGGGRFGVQQARAAEALARQKGDIQAQGLQSAFGQAQQQFNTEQQARLQAALANQQAGLTTGQQNLAAQLGVQQLGTQTGLQTALANLSSAQQANVQNQAAQLQAQGLNSQQALQAALANQQTQQQANLQNLSAGLQTQGLQAQTGLQAQQLNQAAGLQALLANQQAGLTTGQFNAQQAYNTALQNAQMRQQAGLANQQLLGQFGLQQGQFGQQAALQNAQLAQQAALANQQAGLTTGQQNLAAQLGVQQLGAGQNLQAQLANQQIGLNAAQLAAQQGQFGYGQNMAAAQLGAQYGLEAQRAQEASRQFGANLGLQGLQAALSGAGTLGNLGQQQLAAQQGILGLQGQFGQQQQQNQQNIINAALQNYQMQQQYPMQQLAAYSQLLQPFARPSQTQTIYQAPPTMAQQLVGLGLGGAGIAQLLGGGGGGSGGGGTSWWDTIKNYLPFAEGGEVKEEPQRMAEGGIASAINRRVLEDPMSAGPQTYANSQQRGILSPTIAAYANDIQNRMRQAIQASQMMQRSPNPTVLEQQAMAAAQQGQGIDGLPSGLPAQGYAPGGIVAFDEGGEVERFQEGGTPKYYGGFLDYLLPGLEQQERARRRFLQKREELNRPIYAPVSEVSSTGLPTPAALNEQGDVYTPLPTGPLPKGPGVTEPPIASVDKALSPELQRELRRPPRSDAGTTTRSSAGISNLPDLTPAELESRYRAGLGETPYGGPLDRYLETHIGATEKALKTQEEGIAALAKRAEGLRSEQQRAIEKRQEGLSVDRNNLIGFSLLRAANAMMQPGKSFFGALAGAGAEGGAEYMKGNEKLQERADKLSDSLMRVKEASLGDERDRLTAQREFDKSRSDLRLTMVNHLKDNFNMSDARARHYVDLTVTRQAQQAQLGMQQRQLESSERIAAANRAMQEKRYATLDQRRVFDMARLQMQARRQAEVEVDKELKDDYRKAAEAAKNPGLRSQMIKDKEKEIMQNPLLSMISNLREAEQ